MKSVKIRRQLLILLFSMTLLFGYGQSSGIQIIVNEIAGDITYDDLWNINLIKPDTANYTNCYILLKAYDQEKGMMFTAKTGMFSIEVPLTTFTSLNYRNLLQPTINFTSYSNFNSIVTNGGYFPAGNYNFSYELYAMVNSSPEGPSLELLASTSFNKTVNMLFCPLLIEIPDNSIVDPEQASVILFCWTPAFMQNTSTPIFYTLSIYKMYDGQSAIQAVKSNPEFYRESNLSTTCFSYIIDQVTLDDSSSYAWQVKTYTDNNLVCESEAWKFSFKKDTPEDKKRKKIKDPPYYLLEENLADAYAEDRATDSTGTKYNYLRFAISEQYGIKDSIDLKYNIYSEQNILMQNLPKTKVKYHDNHYEIDFDELNLPYGYYILEVISVKNEKMYLRFLYSKNF
jgi:hypothetical protein